jgi:hypothetical protein
MPFATPRLVQTVQGIWGVRIPSPPHFLNNAVVDGVGPPLQLDLT